MTQCAVCHYHNCTLPQHNAYTTQVEELAKFRDLEEHAFCLIGGEGVKEQEAIRSVYLDLHARTQAGSAELERRWNDISYTPYTYWVQDGSMKYMMSEPVNVTGYTVIKPKTIVFTWHDSLRALKKFALSTLEPAPHLQWRGDIRPSFFKRYEWPQVKMQTVLKEHLIVLGATDEMLCGYRTDNVHGSKWVGPGVNHIACGACRRKAYKLINEAIEKHDWSKTS